MRWRWMAQPHENISNWINGELRIFNGVSVYGFRADAMRRSWAVSVCRCGVPAAQMAGHAPLFLSRVKSQCS